MPHEEGQPAKRSSFADPVGKQGRISSIPTNTPTSGMCSANGNCGSLARSAALRGDPSRGEEHSTSGPFPPSLFGRVAEKLRASLATAMNLDGRHCGSRHDAANWEAACFLPLQEANAQVAFLGSAAPAPWPP
eukprot:Polyplicarium_translucidae@DN606_c0_g1_i1.p3